MTKRKSRRDPAREKAWRKRFAQWKESGLSIRDFCRRNELKENTFHYWRSELKRRDQNRASKGGRKAEASPVSFATFQMATPLPYSGERLYADEFEISFSNGKRVRFRAGIPMEALREILQIIETVAC
jgi:hypothetical protein